MWDLLHGLMLPSGNDAATVLAEHFGQYLFEVATKYKNSKAANNQTSGGATGGNQANQGVSAAGAAGQSAVGGGAAADENQRRMQSD